MTYHEVGDFLVQRVDQELETAAQNPRLFFPNFDPGTTSSNGVPPGTYAEFRDQSGDILQQTETYSNQERARTCPNGPIKAGSDFTLSATALPRRHRVGDIGSRGARHA